MAAGAVSPPLIIPIIHLRTHGAKNHIDTSTPVSIQSESSGVLIFFTLDGSRPETRQRGSAGGSRRYSEPVLLPAGRVSVRAVAVTSDGRQSSVVTKVFSVDQVDSGSAMKNKNSLQNPWQHSSDGTFCSAENSAGSSLRNPLRMRRHSPPPAGPRFLNTQLGSKTSATTRNTSSQQSQSADSDELKQLSSTETNRLQRETDFLRCARCLSVRPSDPFARFCAQCGAVVPQLPGYRLPPPEGGQMLLCGSCHSVVPVKTPTCLICEASIDQQTQPKASLSLQDHLVCVSCGCGNPADTSRCLTCERHLQPGRGGNSAPSVRPTNGRKSTCSRCKRLNRSDARFCDWCGSKSPHAASCVTCWRCGASGHPYAFYCTACGVLFDGPAPPTPSDDITQPKTDTAISQAPPPTSCGVTWQATPPFNPPTTSVKVTPPTLDQSTQTAGLYYPSSTGLKSKEQQRSAEVSRQLKTRDHRPPLSATSPGRGYWRKQLDHVCAHLRSYAQNNGAFRALLGEPRLGRMVSAVIQEDQNEVSLTVSFTSAGRREEQVTDPQLLKELVKVEVRGHQDVLLYLVELMWTSCPDYKNFIQLRNRWTA